MAFILFLSSEKEINIFPWIVNYNKLFRKEPLWFFFFVKPDVLTAVTIPCGRDPFLFSLSWVFMAE